MICHAKQPDPIRKVKVTLEDDQRSAMSDAWCFFLCVLREFITTWHICST